jgi:mannitol operon repressor
MKKRQTDAEARRKIRKETPQFADFLDYTDELGRESDRGAVLVAATRIDELLREAISARLIEHQDTQMLLHGFNAPLGTFSARILAAFALGILSEDEYRKCNTIRKIRNEFAHRLGISFNDQRIRDLCATLGPATMGMEADFRRRFSSAAVVLVAHLTRRAEHVSKERVAWQFWGFPEFNRR